MPSTLTSSRADAVPGAVDPRGWRFAVGALRGVQAAPYAWLFRHLLRRTIHTA